MVVVAVQRGREGRGRAESGRLGGARRGVCCGQGGPRPELDMDLNPGDPSH